MENESFWDSFSTTVRSKADEKTLPCSTPVGIGKSSVLRLSMGIRWRTLTKNKGEFLYRARNGLAHPLKT